MRSERGKVWPYLLLALALVASLGFSWYQTKQKNQLALDAENKYMAAFHKLKWTSENIEERTANLMATNDARMQESILADLRVYSAQAVEHMAVLPLLTVHTPRITRFLNTLREKTDEYHYKVNTGTPLSAADWDLLSELRRQAVFFEDELSNLSGLVANNAIHWRDTVKATGPSQSGAAETPITKSVLQIDKGLAGPPGEEKALSPEEGPEARPRIALGPKVDAGAAAAVIKQFVDQPLKAEPRLTDTSDRPGAATGLPLYFFEVQKANGTPLNFGVSVYGGHVIFALDGRPVTDKRLSKEQLINQARTMLHKWGYQSADYVSAIESDGALVMDFAPRENGVEMHTELIKVSLAMDNGELLGFDARNYWINRRHRDLMKPQMDAAQAVQRLSQRLKPEGAPHLVVVADRRGRERLAWEIWARLQAQQDQQRFIVFIDATTGEEVNLLRIAGDPAPPLNKG